MDQDLLHKLRNGDNEASAKLLYSLKKQALRFLKKYEPQHLYWADDLASITLSIILEAKTEPVLTAKVSTYLYSIAKNQWSSLLPHLQRLCPNQRLLDELTVVDTAYDIIESDERKKLVNRSMSMLTEKCRKLLHAFSIGMKCKEASAEMGYQSEKVYQVKKSECLQKLKTIILESPEGIELFSKN